VAPAGHPSYDVSDEILDAAVNERMTAEPTERRISIDVESVCEAPTTNNTRTTKRPRRARTRTGSHSSVGAGSACGDDGAPDATPVLPPMHEIASWPKSFDALSMGEGSESLPHMQRAVPKRAGGRRLPLKPLLVLERTDPMAARGGPMAASMVINQTGTTGIASVAPDRFIDDPTSKSVECKSTLYVVLSEALIRATRQVQDRVNAEHTESVVDRFDPGKGDATVSGTGSAPSRRKRASTTAANGSADMGTAASVTTMANAANGAPPFTTDASRGKGTDEAAGGPCTRTMPGESSSASAEIRQQVERFDELSRLIVALGKQIQPIRAALMALTVDPTCETASAAPTVAQKPRRPPGPTLVIDRIDGVDTAETTLPKAPPPPPKRTRAEWSAEKQARHAPHTPTRDAVVDYLERCGASDRGLAVRFSDDKGGTLYRLKAGVRTKPGAINTITYPPLARRAVADALARIGVRSVGASCASPTATDLLAPGHPFRKELLIAIKARVAEHRRENAVRVRTVRLIRVPSVDADAAHAM
ncbi:MAG TPA: hypothetical protein VIO38_05715, partial [Rariglobus sp.]